jgi:diaminopimelate decarboxylase
MSTGMSVLGEYHEVFPVRDPLRVRERRTTLVGRVPTPLDLLYRNKPMPDLRAGDLLAVMDAGAYMIPTATNFASVKAPVVLLDRGDMRLLQRRETADDLAGRDCAHA